MSQDSNTPRYYAVLFAMSPQIFFRILAKTGSSWPRVPLRQRTAKFRGPEFFGARLLFFIAAALPRPAPVSVGGSHGDQRRFFGMRAEASL
jgi:hypothetical protein